MEELMKVAVARNAILPKATDGNAAAAASADLSAISRACAAAVGIINSLGMPATTTATTTNGAPGKNNTPPATATGTATARAGGKSAQLPLSAAPSSLHHLSQPLSLHNRNDTTTTPNAAMSQLGAPFSMPFSAILPSAAAAAAAAAVPHMMTHHQYSQVVPSALEALLRGPGSAAAAAGMGHHHHHHPLPLMVPQMPIGEALEQAAAVDNSDVNMTQQFAVAAGFSALPIAFPLQYQMQMAAAAAAARGAAPAVMMMMQNQSQQQQV